MRLSVELLSVGQCRHCERMARAGGSWRSVAFPSICALILHPTQGAVLYDTGYAEHFRAATEPFPERLYRWLTPVQLPEGERLQAQLAARGLCPRDIRWCLISHFHADHIAGLRDLPRARFLAMREDFEQLRRSSRLGGLRRGLLPALLPPDFEARLGFAEDRPLRRLAGPWAAFGQGHDLFGDGSLLALPLPGHAPRQMGLRLRDTQDRELLLCADACWSREAWQHQELPAWPARAVLHDWAAYRHTLQRLQALARSAPELHVLPSHCPRSLHAYRTASAPC